MSRTNLIKCEYCGHTEDMMNASDGMNIWINVTGERLQSSEYYSPMRFKKLGFMGDFCSEKCFQKAIVKHFTLEGLENTATEPDLLEEGPALEISSQPGPDVSHLPIRLEKGLSNAIKGISHE